MTTQPTGPTARIPELDGVRGLAAVVVVLFHAFPHGAFSWGWSAVDLFFVLSGYLITRIILERRGEPGFLAAFYRRRVVRIWPVYYLTLLGVVVVNHLSPTGYPTTGWPAYAVFLQHTPRYLGGETPPFVFTFNPSWSVAVEEQFYLVWPLILLAGGTRIVPFCAGGLLATSVVGRLLSDFPILLGTRGDGLALGCLLAWLLARPAGDRLARPIIVGAGLLGGGYVAAYLVRFGGEPQIGWPTTSFTGFGLLYFALIGGSVVYQGSAVLAPLRSGVLRWFGTISYAMYLFHTPIFSYVPATLNRLGVRSPTVVTLLTWGAIIGLPALSWFLLESPLLRWQAGQRRPVRRRPEVARAARHEDDPGYVARSR